MTVCSEFSASACGGHESTRSSGTSYFWALSYGQLDRARLPESGVGMLSLLISLTTLRRWTRAPSHILSYMWEYSCWLLCHEFGREPVSSSEWVKAYGLGRSGWEVFLYRTTALTSSKDTSSPVSKHIPSKPRWSYPVSSNTGLLWFVLQWTFSRWWNQLRKWRRGENSHPCSSDVFVLFLLSIRLCESWTVACNKFPLQNLYVLVHFLSLLQLLLYVLILIINL